MAGQDGNSNEPLNALDLYSRDNQSPLRLIAGTTFGLLMLVMALVTVALAGCEPLRVFSSDWAREHTTRWLYDRHIFTVYVCIFAAWWLVYLGTRRNRQPGAEQAYKRVRTLRRLLGYCSEQWGASGNMSEGRLDQMEESYRNKAQSSMTTIAIMIAVSSLELQHVSEQLEPLFKTGIMMNWEVAILMLSLIFAMVSFIGYIISADSLDVIFNRFIDNDARHRITRYYYQSTINTRYAALISLITSFILLVAYYSPLAGAGAIGLFLVIGYTHWFPDFADKPASLIRRMVVSSGKTVLVLFPLMPVLLEWGG